MGYRMDKAFLNNSYCFDYIQQDSIRNWKDERYDLILSTPPFGRIHNDILKNEGINSFEGFLLIKAIQSLKEKVKSFAYYQKHSSSVKTNLKNNYVKNW